MALKFLSPGPRNDVTDHLEEKAIRSNRMKFLFSCKDHDLVYSIAHAPFLVPLFSCNVIKSQMSLFLSVSVFNDKPGTVLLNIDLRKKKSNKLSKSSKKKKSPTEYR